MSEFPVNVDVRFVIYAPKVFPDSQWLKFWLVNAINVITLNVANKTRTESFSASL